MLEPHARTLLFDVLKPPEDHRLDFGLATTYTLDLLALLAAPVAFTLFEVDDYKELLNANSLTLLEGLRRYADRLTIFCHAGQIAVPKAQFPHFEYLEKAVIECRPTLPSASFHSKIWLLRYLGPGELVTYRLACLTRNLTFDRRWDTVLMLEGPLRDRHNAIAVNHPLGDFVQALPRFAARPVDDLTTARVEQAQSEVRRVVFDVPEGFEEYRFHPVGLEGYRKLPFDNIDGRMLIISPFVTHDGLRRIAEDRPASVLISRPETLQDGACRIPEIDRFYVLADQAAASDTDEEPSPATKGLHAKCYVVDAGWRASVFTGSANATRSAFNGNVEFLVELIGLKSQCGIDTLIVHEDGKTKLIDLLVPFVPPELAPVPDEAQDGLRSAIERVRQALVEARLHATVVNPSGDGTYEIVVEATRHKIELPEGTSVKCWPVTLGFGWARSLGAENAAPRFERVSLEGITAFFAFEIEAVAGKVNLAEAFVLNLPLEGAPEDRRERLLRSVIRDRDRFVRFLLFLLADEGIDLAESMRASRGEPVPGVEGGSRGASSALLEVLVRSLERSPERLDHIARLLEDLQTQGSATDLLPPGFDSIWAPIWAARERSRT